MMITVPDQPRSDIGDTFVDLEPNADVPTYAYGLTKRSYRITDGCRLADGEPCALRLYHEAGLGLYRPGSDGLDKLATDVSVAGCAVPRGAEATYLEVRCTVGAFEKRIAVFGRRFIEWSKSGAPRLGAPEPIGAVAMTNANAYGGVDGRVPLAPPQSTVELLRVIAAYPGIYCRNPAGKGYIADATPIDGVELPQLENPDDLLTDERLVADAAAWWRQPLPWTLALRDLAMFPRLVAVSPPWFDAPEDDTLAEVRAGYLPAGYRTHPERIEEATLVQEASLGMSFDRLEAGTPIEVEGMSPDRAHVRFEVPTPPSFDFEIDGATERVIARATSVVVRPAEERVDITYRGRTQSLPRRFVPTVHKYIPITLRVEGGGADAYRAPPTPHEALVAAGLRKPVSA